MQELQMVLDPALGVRGRVPWAPSYFWLPFGWPPNA
jgi:hypothetical protein